MSLVRKGLQKPGPHRTRRHHSPIDPGTPHSTQGSGRLSCRYLATVLAVINSGGTTPSGSPGDAGHADRRQRSTNPGLSRRDQAGDRSDRPILRQIADAKYGHPGKTDDSRAFPKGHFLSPTTKFSGNSPSLLLISFTSTFSGIGRVLEAKVTKRHCIASRPVPGLEAVFRSTGNLCGNDHQTARVRLFSLGDPDLEIHIVLPKGERIALGTIDDATSQVLRIVNTLHQLVIRIGHQQVCGGQRQIVRVLQLVHQVIDRAGNIELRVLVDVLAQKSERLTVEDGRRRKNRGSQCLSLPAQVFDQHW